MSQSLTITDADLVLAMGKDPATYAVPPTPTPEEFLAKPVVTVFYFGGKPAFLAYDPLHAWFGGWGAFHLAKWREDKEAGPDTAAFQGWFQATVSGNHQGLGCDMLDLDVADDRFAFARALDLLGGERVPLAAELMRIHCLEEGSSGWTPPKGEERLGDYRAKVEEVRAKGDPSRRCVVARGLPKEYATPAIEKAAREAAQVARSKGLAFDLLTFEPVDGATDPLHVSRLYVMATPSAMRAAAAATSVDEARKRLKPADGSFVRLYGGADDADIEAEVVGAFGWLRDQARAHRKRAVGVVEI